MLSLRPTIWPRPLPRNTGIAINLLALTSKPLPRPRPRVFVLVNITASADFHCFFGNCTEPQYRPECSLALCVPRSEVKRLYHWSDGRLSACKGTRLMAIRRVRAVARCRGRRCDGSPVMCLADARCASQV